MADVTITPTDNGPYRVQGTFTIVDAAGHAWETKEAISLCRCGGSANKPFCDGTHKRINFSAVNRPPAGA